MDELHAKEAAQREDQMKKGMEFISVLIDMKGGRVAAQLGDEFQDIIAKVHKHGQQGKLSLELVIKPARIEAGQPKEVGISYKLKTTPPNPNHGVSVFFLGEESQLLRDDPAQMELEG